MSEQGLAASVDVTENFTPFISGDKKIITAGVVIASGETISQFQLLGRVTATHEYKLCVKTATDGSQVPKRISTMPADASGGAVECGVYCEVECNPDQVVLDASWTVDEVKEDLADLGIYFKSFE